MNDQPSPLCGAQHTRFGHFICGLPAGHPDPHGSWVTPQTAAVLQDNHKQGADRDE
jgi:hypothetical protein